MSDIEEEFAAIRMMLDALNGLSETVSAVFVFMSAKLLSNSNMTTFAALLLAGRLTN